MFINKHLWFVLGLFMMSVGENDSPCFASDQLERAPVARAARAHDLLSDHHINLGESKDITDEISGFYLRSFGQSLKKEELTAEEESRLGSIYARSSDYAKTVTIQQELLLEGIRHYLNAADQGRVDVLMSIAIFLEALDAKGDEDLLIRIDPEEKLGDAVIALFKLAAAYGVPEAETAYRDRSSRRSSTFE